MTANHIYIFFLHKTVLHSGFIDVEKWR